MDGGFVGILSVDLHIPEAASLKGKRKELLRIKHALHRATGCAIAEVDGHDLRQRARLTLSVVDRTAGGADDRLDEAERRLYSDPVAIVLSRSRELVAAPTEPVFAHRDEADA